MTFEVTRLRIRAAGSSCIARRTAKAGHAVYLGEASREIDCLHELPYVRYAEKTRSRQRDPGICNTGCLSSPGVQHAGAVRVPDTKKEIGRLRDLSHVWCPEEDLESPYSLGNKTSCVIYA